MPDNLTVVLDGVSQLEYQRDRPLTGKQRQYLDNLDRDMDAGVELGGRRIESPNALQRAQFVAMQLLQAVRDGNEPVAAATCAYLANRISDIKQVRGTMRGGLLSVDLVFDKAYAKEMKVEFVKPSQLN
jgi:hypothetical protein